MGALLAAILAPGCNLGLDTMEKVAPAIADRRLKYVSDWRLVEENQRAALAGIVHGISRLDAAGHWGDGTTSASDGQRFAMPHKVLQRTYSTRFNDFALEFYSFVADNDAPFYSRPIECTARDAPVVLDGVLYHESDLDLEAHDTDTHGYTEINFAAFVLVGMRFCPRIRSLHRQRLSCADPARDHGVLEPVLQRGRRAVNFRLIAEQWDRIGQFDAACPAGHATASAALQRLNRFQASNRFYAANRELGRALKTEFVLQYMSEPQLRATVRRGLLKVEQLHALARAVYDGQRGRLSAREVYDQVNACSCLTLILACIIYGQALEISRIAAAPDFPFDPDLLRHVSPIEWKNVILYGEIKIDPAKLKRREPSRVFQHESGRYPSVNSFALVLTVSAVERQRQNEGHVAYPSTQFLLAKRREREVPNDPRRQHTRVPAAGSAGDAAQWQCECDVSPVRRVSDGVLSVARSADALRARRAASETADRPAGAAPRAHRDRRTAGHRGSAGVADARAAVGERSPGPTGAGHRPGDGLARLAAGRA